MLGACDSGVANVLNYRHVGCTWHRINILAIALNEFHHSVPDGAFLGTKIVDGGLDDFEQEKLC